MVKYKQIFTSLIFYLSILTFIIGFQFSDNRAGGWTQQFMPNLGGRQINDITFTDSLNGYAITNEVSDTSFILKTTNSGNNWFLSHFDTGICSYYNIQFINQSTGFVSGYIYNGSTFRIVKTTNGGLNWFYINFANDIVAIDMFVLNQDTIWLVDSGSLTGGVFRTTNGGTSWEPQAAFGNNNPSHIYMYNARIGFIDAGGLRKTTGGGATWTPPISGAGNFLDMHFVDSLTGWKCNLDMKKTTDGGFNWVTQTLPSGGLISSFSVMKNFSNVNKDSIWGGGGYLNYGGGRDRGILYYTTNGGIVWRFQLPDTSFGIPEYEFVNFTNRLTGWGYESFYSLQSGSVITSGVHTTTGGDPVFYTGIVQTPNAVPEKFILKQNYPNPFNPRTVIPYSLSSPAYVKIIAYDIQGREVQKMVDQYQQAGAYEVDFMGKFTSTGVYFYRMTVTDDKSKIVYTDTRKMVLLK